MSLNRMPSNFENQRFVRSRSVVSRKVGGETLVVPVRGKVGDLASIYTFNGTGSLIWQSLESPRSLSELIAVIEQEYEVAHDQARQDVTQFLQDMMAADLVAPRDQVASTIINLAPKAERHAAG